jgi:hypothetical protein
MTTYKIKAVTISVDVSGAQKLIASLEKKSMEVLDKAAFDIEADAKSLAPVDTGALKNSIYVSGARGRSGGSYATNKNAAKGAASAKGKKVKFTHEIKSASKWERIIAASVVYAVYPEFQGQPYMTPAVFRNRAAFIAAWSTLVK